LYQIWFRGSPRGRNQMCGILLQSAHGFRFCEGSKFAVSHWLGWSPLTQCWRYRAACDMRCFSLQTGFIFRWFIFRGIAFPYPPRPFLSLCLLPSPSSPFLPSPPLTFPIIQLGVYGERCKLPQRVQHSPTDKRFFATVVEFSAQSKAWQWHRHQCALLPRRSFKVSGFNLKLQQRFKLNLQVILFFAFCV